MSNIEIRKSYSCADISDEISFMICSIVSKELEYLEPYRFYLEWINEKEGKTEKYLGKNEKKCIGEIREYTGIKARVNEVNYIVRVEKTIPYKNKLKHKTTYYINK